MQLLSGYIIREDKTLLYYVLYNGIKVYEDEPMYNEAVRNYIKETKDATKRNRSTTIP